MVRGDYALVVRVSERSVERQVATSVIFAELNSCALSSAAYEGLVYGFWRHRADCDGDVDREEGAGALVCCVPKRESVGVRRCRVRLIAA